MREKLGFIGRDIDRHRAFAFAALAGKAKIERLLYFLTPPAVLDGVAFDHLPQQVCAPASRVLLFARHAKTRAHDAAFILPALSYPDAAQHGMRHTFAILGKLEMCPRLPRSIVGS